MTDDTVETPRYRIVGGGTPTPEQLAAVVVALTPVAVADDATTPAEAPTRPSGWRRAALLEAVGSRVFSSPADLAADRVGLT